MKITAKAFFVTIAGTVLIATLAVFWFKTQSVNLAEHARVGAAIRDLRQIDRTVNQDVLQVRFHFANSYDALTDSYQRMDETLAELARPPSYLTPQGQTTFRQSLKSYLHIFDQKRHVIERFKSRNAILRNSLRYFPIIATETIDECRDLNRKSSLSDQVSDLLQGILIYNLNADESQAAKVRGRLETLLAHREEYPEPLQTKRLEMLARHARTILMAKSEVDGLIAEILTINIMAAEKRLAKTYSGGFAQAEQEAARYRTAMYGLCVVLALLVIMMVGRLKTAFAQLAEANLNLEEKVAYRTRELDSKNRDLQLVLDTVDQGFLTLDRVGCMGTERSRRVERWLGAYTPGTPFWEYLALTDQEVALWFQLGFDDLIEGLMPQDVVLSQMPRQLTWQDRHLRIDYKPIVVDERLNQLLITLSDVTLEVEQRAKEQKEREMVAMVRHFVNDQSGFREFLVESQKLVDHIQSGEFEDVTEALRMVHTLKGNCAIYGIASFSRCCHTLESRLVETQKPPTKPEGANLAQAWAQVRTRIQPIVETGQRDTIEITPNEINELRQAIAGGHNRHALLEIIDKWSLEPATHQLNRIADRAKALAELLGRPHMGVIVEADNVRLDSQRMAGFWGSFIHLVRNAVDHGIEPVEERLAAGKSQGATLTLRARREGDGARIEIADDGRGIEWKAIADAARARGLAHQTREDLIAAMCSPGFSTKDTPTTISGRGIGMNAIVEATRRLDGEMCVQSEPGRGTTLTFRLPHVAVPTVDVLATQTCTVAR